MSLAKLASLRSVAVLLGLLIAAGAALLPAASTGLASATSINCSSPPPNCFGLAVTPGAVTAGDTQSFSFTLTNEARAAAPSSGAESLELGSARITAPGLLTVVGASAPSSSPATVQSRSGTSVEFSNLEVPVAGSITLTVVATAPCARGGGSFKWGVTAQISDSFDASSSDYLTLDPLSAGALEGSVTGQCSLQFTSKGEPAGTKVGATIKSGFDSTGGPVQVEVLDGVGALLKTSTAKISVAVAPNGAGGTLHLPTSVNASSGIASFTSLSIDKVGAGYQLVASSPGMLSGASSYFAIFGTIVKCATATCAASSSTTKTSASVSTSSAPRGDYLGVGLGGVTLNCAGYTAVSDPLNFDVVNGSGAALSSVDTAVTLEIAKSVVLASGHPGAASWQICFASTVKFKALKGSSGTLTVGGVSYFTGLLPVCRVTHAAPCIESRNKTRAGQVVVKFLATGDPIGRG